MPPAEWQWWNYLMVGGGVFGMLLFGYLMVMELRKRWTRKPPEWHLEKIKLINNWLEVPETAKRLIILFVFFVVVVGILPPILWNYITILTPLLFVLYIVFGIVLSFDVIFALIEGRRLQMLQLFRMTMGIMMIVIPFIMQNQIEAGGL